jgi:hypothetical protein
MIQRLMGSACLALALVACAPPEPAAVDGPAPDPRFAASFPGCEWGEVQSAGVSVWAFACPGDRLVADPALPGFARETETPDGLMRSRAIALFAKAETDPLNAELPAVRAASPGAATATCAFEELPDMVGHYAFAPTGEAGAAYDALIAGSADAAGTGEPAEPDYMPCGVWGPSEGGQRVFTVVRGAGDKVAGIMLPSDISIFDPWTLRKTE